MKKLSLLIILALITIPLCAQDTSIESSTEQMDSVKFSRLVKSYRGIVMAEREETTLVKLDLFGPLLYLMSGIDTAKLNLIGISFERKFKPEWSWIVAFSGQANKIEFTELRYRGGIRYYFDMKQRILRGRSANNFSANYLSARTNYKHRPNEADSQLSIDILLGVQRRLWKYGYLDVDIGIENIISSFEDNTPGIDFTTSIQLGIAF
ncbi:hypothetical protein [Ekhidna sp.]